MSVFKVSIQYRDNGVCLRKAFMVQSTTHLAAQDKARRWFAVNIGIKPDFRITGCSIVPSINYIIP